MNIVVGSRTFPDKKFLEKLVKHAATQYEQNGYSEDFDGIEITDPEYDELLRALKKHMPESDAFEGTSPSQATVKGSTVKHDPPMTSIDKADGNEKQTIYERWIERCAKSLGVDPSKLEICQAFKRDGVAIRINYINGKLSSAGLRPRNGVYGTDVTEHAKYIQGVPLTLPKPYTLSLNGEIECWNNDFLKVNEECEKIGEDPFKNPRNYTAGCMQRDDALEVKNAKLRIAFYSITGFDEADKFYKTEIERAIWCNSVNGLNLQDKDGNGYFVRVMKHKFSDLEKMEKIAATLPYYTDGIVLKVNNLEDQESLGHVGGDLVKAPHGALAWKFEEETAEAIVTGVEWNASRTGLVVPTATFDKPFILADTANSRATCNNYGWMLARGLGPGAKVRCKKGGKIIPNIMEVLQPVSDVKAPANCPTCNYKLVIRNSDSGNKALVCENKDCGAKHIKGWMFYLQSMDCKGLGIASLKQIMNSGKVKELADLYTLEVDDLTSCGFSERQALLALATIHKVDSINDDVKLLNAIKSAKNKKQSIQAWQFFGALGIPGAGKTAGKALVAHYKNFDSIMNASLQELVKIDGIGETTAAAICDWFVSGKKVVQNLLNHIDLELPKNGKLSGKNFCLTGNFDLGKKHWQSLIENEGGNIQSSVGSTTSYLIQQNGKNDGSPSDKEVKAKKFNVPIISIPDLERILT